MKRHGSAAGAVTNSRFRQVPGGKGFVDAHSGQAEFMMTTVPQPAHGLRRVGAWLLDWVAIAAYAALLLPAALVVGARNLELSAQWWNAIAFGCLIAPATLWLAIWERGERAGSPGKRILGLQVTTLTGQAPGFGRALARNGPKSLCRGSSGTPPPSFSPRLRRRSARPNARPAGYAASWPTAWCLSTLSRSSSETAGRPTTA